MRGNTGDVSLVVASGSRESTGVSLTNAITVAHRRAAFIALRKLRGRRGGVWRRIPRLPAAQREEDLLPGGLRGVNKRGGSTNSQAP